MSFKGKETQPQSQSILCFKARSEVQQTNMWVPDRAGETLNGIQEFIGSHIRCVSCENFLKDLFLKLCRFHWGHLQEIQAF